MTSYNVAINRLDMPARFLKLPVDDRGFPVPKFVEWIDGKPDFRVVNAKWMIKAVQQKLCWLCGEKLGRFQTFVLGPMCAINRVNSEPPSHLDCSRFAAKACPFLTQPKRGRNEHELPAMHDQPAGIPIYRNPGVVAVWITENYSTFRPEGGGILFSIGDPVAIEWYARGRRATRDEIMHSIETGIPLLRKVAEQESPEAVAALEEQVRVGLALVPATG